MDFPNGVKEIREVLQNSRKKREKKSKISGSIMSNNRDESMKSQKLRTGKQFQWSGGSGNQIAIGQRMNRWQPTH